MSPPTIDVVIVDFNAGKALVDCVRSVCAADAGGARIARIVVVDNASSPPTRDVLGVHGDRVHVVRNDMNRGFAAACNQGARGSEAEFLLFLNPDTIVTAESIAVPAAFLSRPENAAVGVVGIQLVDAERCVTASCFEFPRVGHYWNKALALDRVSPAWFPVGAMSTWDHRTTRDVDQVIGAFYFARRSLFETLGGFDERFFVYFEEMDFARRARDAGFRTVFLADARAVHTGEGTTKAIKATRLFYSWRSRLQYAAKHFSRPAVASIGVATLVVEPVTRCVLALGSGSPAAIKDVGRAWGALLRDTAARAFGQERSPSTAT